MRKIVLISLLFIAKIGFCQLADNFTDGNLHSDPVWTGSNSATDFIVTDGILRSNSTNLNTNFYLSTPNNLALNCRWEFWCNLKFNTSGANYTDIYLIADQQNLQHASINGYFLRIGSTDDDISLYKRSGALNAAVKLIDGANGVTATTNNLLKIVVTRTAAGLFTLQWDNTGKGITYTIGGTATDLTYSTTAWFGIYVQQSTASFIQKHFYDDFIIKPLSNDIISPDIVAAIPFDGQHIDVEFTETVDVSTATNLKNYRVGDQMPTAVIALSPVKYRLTFDVPLTSGNYELFVNNVADVAGNGIAANSMFKFAYIKAYTSRYRDVVINEVFADPSPQIGLPTAEFVELWNTTTEYISLENWKYSDQTSTYNFGKQMIAPGGYLVLCAKTDEYLFASYGEVLGLAPWPSLNNDKDVLKLMDDKGMLIDEVAYKDSWYKDDIKKQGGFSLEQIDPKNRCTGIQNWQSATAGIGGTPGKQNSVYQAQLGNTKPRLIATSWIDNNTIVLTFSKAIDSNAAAAVTNYKITGQQVMPESAVPQGPYFNTVILRFKEEFKRGIIHRLIVENITDCAGNTIDQQANAVELFQADKILPGDLLISEVLFNPLAGGVDFVELYNNSNHVLDLSMLQIANEDPATIRKVTMINTFITPGSYWVLTAAPEIISSGYHIEYAGNFVKVSLPAYKVAAGTVNIISEGQIIDQFAYTEQMHIPLLKEVKGIALERIALNRPAGEPGNFSSASASAGYATPTYKNSITGSVSSANTLSIYPGIFSPDGDGVDEILQINYGMIDHRFMGSLSVYNDRGWLVRKLARNQNLATAGQLIWDGRNDNGQLCPTGIYILKLDVFNLDGKTQHFKKACVLAGKLNR